MQFMQPEGYSKRPIKLVVDMGVPYKSPGGIHLHKELLLSVANQLPDKCQIISLQSDQVSIQHPNLVTDSIPTFGNAWKQYYLWAYHLLPEKIKKHQANVFFSMNGIFTTKLRQECGIISTYNNMVPFTQEQWKHFPFLSKDRVRFFLLRKLFSRSIQSSDIVLLHSKHACKQISSAVGPVAHKTIVSFTGIPSVSVSEMKSLPRHPYNNKPYLLYLSAIYWYKNHSRLIEAYKKALEIDFSLPNLIIAGYPVENKIVSSIYQMIEYHNLKDRVFYIGAVEQEDIPAWLHYADFNIFPSTCETSSIVIPEIFGMKGVLACSDIPPMPEIAGPAAELFDPYDTDSMAKTILALHRDKRRCSELRKLAGRRTNAFSWDNCGRAIWEAAQQAQRGFEARIKKGA